MGGGNYEYSGAFDDDLSSALNGVFGREQQRDAEAMVARAIEATKQTLPTPITKAPASTKPQKKAVHVGTIYLDKEDAEKLKRLSFKHGDVAIAIRALIHDANI